MQLVDAAGRRTRLTADWFVSAMPAEQARRFWSPAIRRLDPHVGPAVLGAVGSAAR